LPERESDFLDKSFFNPAEIAANFIGTGCQKTNLPAGKQFMLGILAGAFIAFAAEGSNVAIHTINAAGIAKTLAGALFAVGLMLVIVAGAELFTGNSLIIIACLEKKTSWLALLKNWLFVYIGNFCGAMLIVYLIIQSGQLNLSGGCLGGFTIKTAVYKCGLSFGNAFCLGIMCNWLVCLAVWMAAAAKDITGKLAAIFFPIWLFVTSGFEHSIANMYYIPAGILAKSHQSWVAAAIFLGVAPEKIAVLNWSSFLIDNLIPVTLGNVLGGCLLVGGIYWFCHLNGAGKAPRNYSGTLAKS
jgi:formate/nitrite transporter